MHLARVEVVPPRRGAHFLANLELLSRSPVTGGGGVGSVKTLVTGGILEWSRIWDTDVSGEPQEEPWVSKNDRGCFGEWRVQVIAIFLVWIFPHHKHGT